MPFLLCDWLKQIGLSWQVVPARLMELLSDKDKEKASLVMQAMMKLIKPDATTLEKAVKG